MLEPSSVLLFLFLLRLVDSAREKRRNKTNKGKKLNSNKEIMQKEKEWEISPSQYLG